MVDMLEQKFLSLVAGKLPSLAKEGLYPKKQAQGLLNIL
jgi:hypothetical protein